MKSYLDLIPKNARVHRKQNRLDSCMYNFSGISYNRNFFNIRCLADFGNTGTE